VQEKDGRPLIDLNAKFLAEVFGKSRTLHVRVSRDEIVLSVHRLDEAVRARPNDRSMGSVFTGAGLLDEAGVNAGFSPKWAVEIDRRTADTYAANHPDTTVFEMSAHEAAFSELSSVELLVMGLPCQPWSRARTLNADGSKRDFRRPATEHELGDMAFWALMIVAKVNPRTLVLECAPGFKDGELAASFAGALRRLGYVVSSEVLNAGEHGSLSNRKRTVLVAQTPNALGEAPSPFPAATPRTTTVASIMDPHVPNDAWWDRTTKEWVFRVNERNAAKGSGFGFQVVKPEDTAIGTITAEYGETKNDQPVIAHPTRPDTYRYFTVSEGRRLFGLRPDYILPEAKTVAWRLLGQAVFIPLFEKIIKQATGAVPVRGTSLAGLPLFAGA
jgi:site-specific DNA-cytosine methylase